MPVPWFTVEEEKPDIGTVIFKADDYYERLQHITGMWNDNKFLHYEMFKSPKNSDEENAVDPSTIFNVGDISNVPQLLAYLDRSNMKGVLASDLLDFMWDLHKLYIKKMSEFGYATHWMSKKEFALLENKDKWVKLIKAMELLRLHNLKQEARVKKRKRTLIPTIAKFLTRIDDLPGTKINKRGSILAVKPGDKNKLQKQKLKSKSFSRRKSSNTKSKKRNTDSKLKKHQGEDDTKISGGSKTKDVRKLYKSIGKRHGGTKAFIWGNKPENVYSWDFGKSRLFDRQHLRAVGKHFEFTRIYHKVSKALRFSRSEPVDWRTITLAEVDKHRYINDCWMVIKGRVYDVTEYLNQHPGGSQLVMQGAGIDATGIFVAVHPYVVFYKHLVRKQIGTVPNYMPHYPTEWEPPAKLNIYDLFMDWLHRPKHPCEKWRPNTSFKQTDTEYLYTVSFPKGLISRVEDWTITIINGFQVTIIKHVETPTVWYGGFDLRTKVMDDTVYRSFSQDYNSVELKIAKSYKVHVRKPIKDKRQDDGFFFSSYSLKDMYRASVVERTTIVDGVKLYGISVGMNKLIGCPIGCYVNLKILDETRPYTPVCLPDEFEDSFREESGDFQTLFFIIKEFKDGDFTSMLHHMPTKKILLGVDIYVSPPMGNFRIDFLFSEMDIMLLIAGGTGISVMTRIIQEYIQKWPEMKGKVVCLFHFVQYREDLIWKQLWTDLAKKYEWFHYYYSLTRVYRYTASRETGDNNKLKSESSKSNFDKGGAKKGNEKRPLPTVLEHDLTNLRELYGYPASSKLKHIISHIEGAAMPQKKHKAIVCGPYGFNHSCKRMINEFGKYNENNVHYFAG